MGYTDLDQLAINTIRVLAVGFVLFFFFCAKKFCGKSIRLTNLFRLMPHSMQIPAILVLLWDWPQQLIFYSISF